MSIIHSACFRFSFCNGCHNHLAQAKYIPPGLRKKMEEGGGGAAPDSRAARYSGSFGGGGGSREGGYGGGTDRWRGAMSVASAASRFSTVSMNPTGHAAERAQEQAITEDDIKRAKRQGKMSLSIHLNDEEDTNDL